MFFIIFGFYNIGLRNVHSLIGNGNYGPMIWLPKKSCIACLLCLCFGGVESWWLWLDCWIYTLFTCFKWFIGWISSIFLEPHSFFQLILSQMLIGRKSNLCPFHAQDVTALEFFSFTLFLFPTQFLFPYFFFYLYGLSCSKWKPLLFDLLNIFVQMLLGLQLGLLFSQRFFVLGLLHFPLEGNASLALCGISWLCTILLIG